MAIVGQHYGGNVTAMVSMRPDDNPWLVEEILFEIIALAASVDDQEVGDFAQRGEDAVPGVHRHVDALAGRAEEGAGRAGHAAFIGADDGEEGALCQRVEGLAAERVAL